MKKLFPFIVSALLLTGGMRAQEPARMPVPPSFQFTNSLLQPSQVCRVQLTEDVDRLRAEDMERMKDGHPLRMAVPVAVDVEFEGTGADWLSLPDGRRIWQRSIQAEGANGLMAEFDELYIPQGGELYIYTDDREPVQLLDHTTNPDGGRYCADRMPGGELILEYVQPAASRELPRIRMTEAGYVYRTRQQQQADLSCFIDVRCEEGDNWRRQIKGVVAMEMKLSDGWYVCSGSLVNNTRRDGTPYILTAHHCIEDTTAETLPLMKFHFFHESNSTTTCTSQANRLSLLTRTREGARVVADVPLNQGSDGALLLLTQPIPADWDVYYNGWDARGIAPTSGVCIHHPNGMVKKISTFTSLLIDEQWMEFDPGTGKMTIGADGAHWRVQWARTANGHSTTFGGSSGSPLFNEEGLIVATLTGGSSMCEAPRYPDYFGKFSYHWDGYADDPKQYFKNYLDPDRTGVLTLEGYDPNATALPGVQAGKAGGTEVSVADGHITVRRASDEATSLTLYTITGTQLRSQTVSGHELSLPAEGLASGVYLVQVGDDTHKVVIR